MEGEAAGVLGGDAGDEGVEAPLPAGLDEVAHQFGSEAFAAGLRVSHFDLRHSSRRSEKSVTFHSVVIQDCKHNDFFIIPYQFHANSCRIPRRIRSRSLPKRLRHV